MDAVSNSNNLFRPGHSCVAPLRPLSQGNIHTPACSLSILHRRLALTLHWGCRLGFLHPGGPVAPSASSGGGDTLLVTQRSLQVCKLHKVFLSYGCRFSPSPRPPPRRHCLGLLHPPHGPRCPAPATPGLSCPHPDQQPGPSGLRRR